MKKLAAILSISFCLLCPAIGFEQTHEEFTGKVTLDVHYRYLLALPDGYKSDAGRKWSLIVFLHGAGERGTNLETLKKHGPPKLIAAGQKFEAIVASLQCLPQQIWNPHGVKALTDELIKTLRVDADRVYLTGLSMGGFATWETALEYPDTYAAIVPICGGAGVRFVMAERIKHLPVWIFHGARDPVVEPSYSKKMFDALTKVGGNVKLTMYPDAQHDSWTAAYNDPELWKWLFAQKRGGS
jgi:predicted peptidase